MVMHFLEQSCCQPLGVLSQCNRRLQEIQGFLQLLKLEM
jgi:hypothetical protein